LGPPGGEGGKGRGMEGVEGRREGREGEEKGGKGRRERRGREGVHNLRKTTPSRHQMAGYGPGVHMSTTTNILHQSITFAAPTNHARNGLHTSPA